MKYQIWDEQNNIFHPALALLKQGQIVAKADKQEREYTDEEWEQRKSHDQEQPHE